MSIEVLYGVIGSLLTAIVGGIVFVLRESASTRRYAGQARADAEKAQADGDLITVRAQASLLADVSAMAKTGIETQKSVIEVVRENTNAFSESAAEMRGMVAMNKELREALRHVALGTDEAHQHISGMQSDVTAIKDVTSTLETNLEESIGSISEQFGPIVLALTSIGNQLAALIKAVSEKDDAIKTQLTALITDFHGAETRLMKTLEPIVIKHLSDFLPADAPAGNPNGKPTNDHAQELPVTIEIKSASTPKDSKS